MHGQTRSNNGTSTTRSGRLAANAANAAAPATAAMATAAMATAARADFPPLHAIEERVDRLIAVDRPRYRRLWNYCRNPMRAVGAGATGGDQDRPYRQAQEWGLPARITGARPGGDVLGGGGGGGGIADVGTRKEVVIENDIGWRIETMVDYLFGRPLVIESAAPDPDRRALISELLRQVLAVNGGILLLQEMALLGSVYGFVDVLVKLDADAAARAATAYAHEAAATAAGAGDLGEPPA
ncbi:MAG TPA: hypothetical protein VER17_20925, partial [Tepidisphaeraceae bacterium]|nr:hypothetical protein [Tepidisphaeraceae bacterium]